MMRFAEIRRSTRRVLLSVALLGAVAACSGQPYGSGFEFGPKEVPGGFEIWSTGSANKSLSQVEARAIYKAAKVTLNKGASKFRIVSAREERIVGGFSAGRKTVAIIVKTDKATDAGDTTGKGWFDAQKVVNQYLSRPNRTKKN